MTRTHGRCLTIGPALPLGVPRLLPLLLLLLLLLLDAAAFAQSYTSEAFDEAAPKDVADELAKTLTKTGVRVVDKKKSPVVDLWFRVKITPPEKSVAAGGVSFTKHVEPGAFVGVARFHKKHYDFRDKSFPAGVYTMRYGIQPQDGDHLGVSDTRDFVVLAPAGKDRSEKAVKHEELMKLGSAASKKSHPAALFLVGTASRKSDKLPALYRNKERNWYVVDFAVAVEGAKDKPLRLGLVVVGKAEEF